jgi:hexosaminidase
LDALKAIVVDSTFQNSRDTEGKTLIPPTLLEFAETFSADLKDILNVSVPVKTAASSGTDSVFLTLSSDSDEFLDVAGRKTSEGYSFEVTTNGVKIAGASPLGVWWGTRTLLQQAVLGEMKIPLGTVSDSPGWGTRGIMVRTWRLGITFDLLVLSS